MNKKCKLNAVGLVLSSVIFYITSSLVDFSFYNHQLMCACLNMWPNKSHISQKHEGFELSFPTMSLASEGSISDIYEKCQQCGKTFENELDLANHVERVHEYGELLTYILARSVVIEGLM